MSWTFASVQVVSWTQQIVLGAQSTSARAVQLPLSNMHCPPAAAHAAVSVGVPPWASGVMAAPSAAPGFEAVPVHPAAMSSGATPNAMAVSMRPTSRP
jgi:hypothetical protein